MHHIKELSAKKISPHFMEPWSSLKHSKETTICNYPKADHPFHDPISVIEIFLILSSRLHLDFPSGLFPSDIPTKSLCTSPTYALIALQSHFLI